LKSELLDDNPVDRKRLKVIIDALVVSATPLGQSSTVAWALWTALLFDIKLSARASQELSHSSDSVIACLAFEMHSRGLLKKSFDTAHLSSLVAGQILSMRATGCSPMRHRVTVGLARKALRSMILRSLEHPSQMAIGHRGGRGIDD
jgi:hypothetical protein